MCYAIPGKVKEVSDKTVIVDYFGQEKKAINEFYDIKPGDYISAQGGFVIKKVSPKEAEETLAAWSELFFELQEIDLRLSQLDLSKQNIDKKLSIILDKALENIPLKEKDLNYLFSLKDPQANNLIFKVANFLRQKYHQNSCCIHGIIEISNFCRQSCNYCGIGHENKNLRRYRMPADEIVEAAVTAVNTYGFQALVLQSGEECGYSASELSQIIKTIKAKVAVLICISFGEIGLSGLAELYRAGARAILMRFETSNPDLFEKLRPGSKLQTRLDHLKRASELGYIIMTGALIGLPGQTQTDIINDIYLAKALGAEMYSFGPFLPHPDTQLACAKTPDSEDVLKTLALIRLVDPEAAKILITTAFETLTLQGPIDARKQGLLSGANSLMLNVTPCKYRKDYAIYPNKADIDIEIDAQITETINLLKSLGRAPTDLGVASRSLK